MEAPPKLIEPWMTLREVRLQFPGTAEVFEQFGIAYACADCSVTEAAHRARASLSELLWALNQVALARQEKLE